MNNLIFIDVGINCPEDNIVYPQAQTKIQVILAPLGGTTRSSPRIFFGKLILAYFEQRRASRNGSFGLYWGGTIVGP